MNTFRFIFLLGISLFFCSTGFSQQNEYPNWTHIAIDPILPGSTWGTGGPALADFDNDGDLDVAVSRRNTKSAYWYEQLDDSTWIPHLMGMADQLAATLGTTSIDIDHDGLMDVFFDGVWFQNPGQLDEYPEQSWQAYQIQAGGHDALTVDIDQNGVNDILVYDGYKIAWYNTSDQFKENIISYGYEDHGGTAPHGYGDLDGDDDIDVIIPGFWFTNPGTESGQWERYEWPFTPVPNASYGRSARAWIADIDADGDNDIIYSHCDTGGSHVYWVKKSGNGQDWESMMLPDPPTRKGDVEGTGSFHSLGVADFNQDGHLDIFAGEQEDPDVYMEADGKVAMRPRGLKERGVIWYSNGNHDPGFTATIIHIDNPGWHDAQLGDIDGDGDIDIVSKVWNADGQVYHLDYWRNEGKE